MKKKVVLGVFLLWMAAITHASQLNANLGPSEPSYRVRAQINVRIPMQDGVTLSADVYRPDVAGRFPVLLMRTYWGKHEPWKIKSALYFAGKGYAVVLQDIRGRFDSGGEYTPYINDPADGFNTQLWL